MHCVLHMFTLKLYLVLIAPTHERMGRLSRPRWSVASPGFVVRRGKAVNLVMGHSRRTSGLQQRLDD